MDAMEEMLNIAPSSSSTTAWDQLGFHFAVTKLHEKTPTLNQVRRILQIDKSFDEGAFNTEVFDFIEENQGNLIELFGDFGSKLNDDPCSLVQHVISPKKKKNKNKRKKQVKTKNKKTRRRNHHHYDDYNGIEIEEDEIAFDSGYQHHHQTPHAHQRFLRSSHGHHTKEDPPTTILDNKGIFYRRRQKHKHDERKRQEQRNHPVAKQSEVQHDDLNCVCESDVTNTVAVTCTSNRACDLSGKVCADSIRYEFFFDDTGSMSAAICVADVFLAEYVDDGDNKNFQGVGETCYGYTFGKGGEHDEEGDDEGSTNADGGIVEGAVAIVARGVNNVSSPPPPPARSSSGSNSSGDQEDGNPSVINDDHSGRECSVSYKGNPCHCEMARDDLCIKVYCTTGNGLSDDIIERCPEHNNDLELSLERALRFARFT